MAYVLVVFECFDTSRTGCLFKPLDSLRLFLCLKQEQLTSLDLEDKRFNLKCANSERDGNLPVHREFSAMLKFYMRSSNLGEEGNLKVTKSKVPKECS